MAKTRKLEKMNPVTPKQESDQKMCFCKKLENLSLFGETCESGTSLKDTEDEEDNNTLGDITNEIKNFQLGDDNDIGQKITLNLGFVEKIDLNIKTEANENLPPSNGHLNHSDTDDDLIEKGPLRPQIYHQTAGVRPKPYIQRPTVEWQDFHEQQQLMKVADDHPGFQDENSTDLDTTAKEILTDQEYRKKIDFCLNKLSDMSSASRNVHLNPIVSETRSSQQSACDVQGTDINAIKTVS